ncbi:PIN domain-containing protein [Lachnospiraceae bacterium 47-T17]
MGRKLKVYLDTSVISHLMQEDVPEKMVDTRKLWEMFKNGVYEVCLSSLTMKEVSDCSEPKRSALRDYLKQIQYESYDITKDVLDVAHQLIAMGVLTNKSFDDCQHIGAAVVNNCDCIISWNFKHIVNIKTIRGVRAITNLEGYKPIEIWSPSVLLESEG